MPGNPLEEGNKVFDIIKDVRVRKGLKPEIPALSNYYGMIYPLSLFLFFSCI